MKPNLLPALATIAALSLPACGPASKPSEHAGTEVQNPNERKMELRRYERGHTDIIEPPEDKP